MKKYWKLISITAIIVLSIGTFYVNVALSAEQFPTFVIKTVSGDIAEIKPLVLQGYYEETNSYVSNNLTITTEGSTYMGYTFLDQLIGKPDVMIKELQEEYRGFMRGKTDMISLFSEDDQYLAYGDVSYKMGSMRLSDFKFDVSLLNKKDGDTNAFTLDVPNNENLDYMFVDSVQLNGNELTLITQNSIRKNDEYYDEKHIYTINIDDQAISSHEELYQATPSDGNTYTNVQLIGTNTTNTNEHIILLKTEEEMMEEMESSRTVEMNQEIISYNLETKKRETNDVPELNLEENQLSFFEGSTLYFTKVAEQELVVTPYSLMDDQVGQAITLPISSENEEGVQPPMIMVNNGKIYVAESQMNKDLDSNVVVADLNTGETLFEGQIALGDSSEEIGNYELYFHEIVLR
ncbi:hypothetical protein [Paraliobacillus sp. X-1268]|uniref:hypothetical protein n=1 Tax=Paraliobacillus sp. X-1268 TaxID=2213193 RepID=UPI000E3BCE81|nr:hypothetical protein [Paraliobacillus sp. X-1268]